MVGWPLSDWTPVCRLACPRQGVLDPSPCPSEAGLVLWGCLPLHRLDFDDEEVDQFRGGVPCGACGREGHPLGGEVAFGRQPDQERGQASRGRATEDVTEAMLLKGAGIADEPRNRSDGDPDADVSEGDRHVVGVRLGEGAHWTMVRR